jgi:16S rRNA pseudouridine516 synthase
MRLDRCLSNSGLGSRSEVKEWIRKGLVSVSGEVIRDCGFAVWDKDEPEICVAGQPIVQRRHIHIMLNKPTGLITAMEDPRLPTIAGLIPDRLKSAGLFPVGRLDRDATGLLLLTNDGTLGHRLANPRWQVWKTYDVTVVGPDFIQEDCRRFADGLILSDGHICKPSRLEIVSPRQALLSIHEGKYHQVKRMMLSTGRKVTVLHRRSVGTLKLDEKLAPGQCRELDEQEILLLYDLVCLCPGS